MTGLPQRKRSTFAPEGRIVVKAYFEGFGPVPEKGEAATAFAVRPKSASVTRTPRHQPDTWSVEFDVRSFPIDPHMLRAAAVEIFLFNKSSVDEPVISVGAGTAPRLSRARQVGPTVAGLVKEVSLVLEDGGTVHLDGEDFTALFARKRWDSDDKGRPKPIDVNRRLDLVLEDMIRRADKFRVISLATDLSFPKEALPTLSKILGRTAARRWTPAQDSYYWDVMNLVADAAGLSLYVRNTDVVLADPETLFAKSKIPIYHFRYGTPLANLSSLGMSRQLGRESVPQIEVRAYDQKRRKTLVVRFPEKQQEVADGVGWKRDERRVVRVHHVADKATCERIARSVFYKTGRGEIEVNFASKDLIDARELDLLAAQAGDGAYFEVGPTVDDLSHMATSAAREGYLRSVGYGPEAANLMAVHFDKAQAFRSFFYMREFHMDWQADSGISISGTAGDYVTTDGTR